MTFFCVPGVFSKRSTTEAGAITIPSQWLSLKDQLETENVANIEPVDPSR
jgi:hypothetical protein